MINIGQEVIVTRNDDTFSQQRYWHAKVVDVFKGSGLVAGTSIYLRTMMDAATCGTDLRDRTRYLLTGTAWPADYQADELNYDGIIIWVDICHLTTPWTVATTQELEIICALPEPTCNVVNCETCKLGYFDECSSCDCRGPDGHGSGNNSICITDTCPPGTQTTAPVCRCRSDNRVCPGTGVIIRRVGSDICKFATCPPPRQPTGCCPDDSYSECREYSQCPDGSFVYRDPGRL
jgi:hypothetical protein